MRYLSILLLAFSVTGLMALPAGNKAAEAALAEGNDLEFTDLDVNANERANDGAKAVENEIETAEAVALSEAGCGGAVVKGDICEAIDAGFQAKLADALAALDDGAAAAGADAKADAKADAGADAKADAKAEGDAKAKGKEN